MTHHDSQTQSMQSTERCPDTNLPAMPESASAEAAMIAAMIQDYHQVPLILELVPNQSMLWHDENRELWQIVMRVYKRGASGLDGITVRNELERTGALAHVGGVEYLRRVVESLVSSSTGEYYAEIVRDRAIRRRLLEAAGKAAQAAHEAETAEAATDEATEAMREVCEAAAPKANIVTVMDALTAAYREMENETEPTIVPTYHELTDVVPGFYPGEMIVIAGRPGHGKTAFALSLLLRNYLRGKNVRALFVSLEMRAPELSQRCLSTMTKIPFRQMRSGALGHNEWTAIHAATSDLSEWDLLFADHIKSTPTAIRNYARALHRKTPLDAVIVDYIQRMHCERQRASRDWEITEISNGLKNLALELNCPVIAISQLNRAVESREDKRPKISDLRGSGSIEQDADTILIVYRQDAATTDPTEHNNQAEIHVAKQRHGPTRSVTLTWVPSGMTFENYAVETSGEFWDEDQDNDSNV